MLTWFVDFFDRSRQRRQEVHVRIHSAFLLSDPRQPACLFVNVQNKSPEREIQVTHVWFDTEPAVPVLTRTLPVRIAPRCQWETWLELSALPLGGHAPETLGRVQLADDTVIRSVPRTDVPPIGYVPE